MKTSVNVGADRVATLNDVMQLIFRLSYLDLLEFAEAVEGDADKIALAAKVYVIQMMNNPA